MRSGASLPALGFAPAALALHVLLDQCVTGMRQTHTGYVRWNICCLSFLFALRTLLLNPTSIYVAVSYPPFMSWVRTAAELSMLSMSWVRTAGMLSRAVSSSKHALAHASCYVLTRPRCCAECSIRSAGDEATLAGRRRHDQPVSRGAGGGQSVAAGHHR